MVDAKDKWRVQDAYASDDLCVGEDHRTVNAVLTLKKRQAPKKRASPKNKDPSSANKKGKQKMINRRAGCHRKVEQVEHTGDHKENEKIAQTSE